MAVVVIGHPVLDEVAHADRSTIERMGLTLGATVRLDARELDELASCFPERRTLPGGAGPNTASTLAALGHRTSLVGLVSRDHAGLFLTQNYRRSGIHILVPPLDSPEPTTRSLILAAPDGEAATAIAIGVTEQLTADHLPATAPAGIRWIYVEGRVLDQIDPSAMLDFANRMTGQGARFAFSLAGRREVDRHRSALTHLLLPACDLVFGTEVEFAELATTGETTPLLARLSLKQPRVVMTQGSDGAVLAEQGELRPFRASPPPVVVDTTGAGDAFAAGFLIGEMAGLRPADCMSLASALAAHMVKHLGSWTCGCPDLITLVRSVREG